jgi:hypothetical protein
MQQSRVYVGMILILIFGEVLGLYGCESPQTMGPFLLTFARLIVGLILHSHSQG